MMTEIAPAFVTTKETGNSIYRLCHLQFNLSRAIAGWETCFKTIADHCELTLVQYEDMQACELLYKRMAEIPGGFASRQPQGALARLLHQISCAPDTDAFWLGIFAVLKPALVRAYLEHSSRTDVIMDTQSWEAMQKNWKVQQEQIDRNQIATNLIKERGTNPALADQWCAHLTSLINLAGGILGNDDNPPSYDGKDLPSFAPSRKFQLEARQKQTWSGELEFPVENAQICNYYLNTEICAVPRIGRIIYEVNGMPWEFYFDTARHMWDELRHFQMGRTRLIELGYDPFNYTVPVWVYDSMRETSAMEDYAQLVLIAEANSFDYKQIWKKKCLEIEDYKSSAQQDFDIVDEQRHVRYGKKWMPVLRELFKDPRPIEQIAEDAVTISEAAMARMMKDAGDTSIYDGIAYWRKIIDGTLDKAS